MNMDARADAAVRMTYTVPELASLLGLSQSVVREALRNGSIPGELRVGRRVVVSRPILDRWIEAGA